MKTNRLIPLLLFIFFLLSSCEKSKETYKGKPIDIQLIGEWTRSYSSVSQDMQITLYTDSIIFKSDNTGIWSTYRFRAIESSSNFNFFTSLDTIHLMYTQKNNYLELMYDVKGDSLILDKNNIFKR
jgi:hypothetical protein